uniref:Uncharacterized protein n=1 Tax=Arundo donax TaxID=35708 RepID=A0A0A9F1G8_ARUDO
MIFLSRHKLYFLCLFTCSPLQTIPCLCSELAQLQGTYILQGFYTSFYFFIVIQNFDFVILLS